MGQSLLVAAGGSAFCLPGQSAAHQIGCHENERKKLRKIGKTGLEPSPYYDLRARAVSPGYGKRVVVAWNRADSARNAGDRSVAGIGRAARRIGFEGRADRGRVARTG